MRSFELILIHLLACLISLGQSYAVTGLDGGVNRLTGQRPLRQEFSNFKGSGPAFDLYILSLQQFQQENQTSLLSYYQVAGVHGYPFTSWDGVQGQNDAGYCTHASILFPTWHRPYVALFEQLLWTNAQRIAGTYPPAQKAAYQAAAISFRVPYWDWAFNSTIPDPVNDPMISVNTPTGIQSIVNPLYNYTFHPQPSESEFPSSERLSKYHSTVRYPTASGQSQPALANQKLQANARALHDLTYQLLADTSSYGPFADTAYSDDRGGSYNSIENMHNAIHSFVGGNGHMAIIPFAAFDPIFWLHHVNVDRLFAMWQAIYPDSYTTPYASMEETFTNAKNEIEDINTALTPFHSTDSGTLHTSASVRSTLTFGYTYPEVIDWNTTTSQLSSAVRTNLNNLYNPTGSIAARALPSDRQQHHNPRYSFPNTTAEYQYHVNIRVDKTTLLRPFYIHFFLGPVPSDPLLWSHAPALIASHAVLYHPPATSPPPTTNSTTNLTSRSTSTSNPILAYGTIPSTHALLQHLSPDPLLSPSEAIPFLTAHLVWRIQDFHNVPIPTSSLDSLRIFVVGRTVVRGAADQFPAYGEWTIWREATSGKEGGLRVGEGF